MTLLFIRIVADFLLMISLSFCVQYSRERELWISKELLCTPNLFPLTLNRTRSVVFPAVLTLDYLYWFIYISGLIKYQYSEPQCHAVKNDFSFSL